MPLSANRNVQFYTSQELIELPVKDNVNIYKGAFVGHDRATGYVRPLVAGDAFVGIAYRRADNTIDGHTAGGINVALHQNVDIVHTLTGVAVADIGKDAFASADNTLTLTPTGNSRVGRVVAVEGTNLARVRCEPVFTTPGVFGGSPITLLADEAATLTLDHMNRTLMMANTAARVLTLPGVATVRAGTWFRIIKTSSAAFAITLDGNASETIDGSTTFADIDAQHDTALLMCTGSAWVILSRDIAS